MLPRQNDDRQRVLDATDIVALVGDHVALRPKGREHVCLCPFHDDHNPSMYVVPHKQIFHCFVCGAGGNAIDFVMKYHAMEFPEALRHLAERAGIELTPRREPRRGERADGVDERAGPTRDELARANAFALEFFRAVLAHPEHGTDGRALIERRGISEEMRETFQLGLAPHRWDGLLRTIESRGLDPAPFLGAGLLKRRAEGGGLYDAFRNRLIFPILDQAGRAIAFGGRIIDPEDEPKYLNSQESALFQKGSTLFGLRQAARPIQESRRAIVTEGYTDVIACHQAGVRNVVATLGTALTERHAALLRRLCDEVIVLFDGDEAGQRAADRAFEVFFREPVDVRVVLLPDGQDPADLLGAPEGAGTFSELLGGAQDLLSYRFERLRAAFEARGQGPGSAGRARAVEEWITRLVDLGLGDLPVIRRRTIVRRLARLAGVDERTISEAMSGVRPRRRAAEAAQGADPAPRRPEGHAEHALACLLAEPSLVRRFPELARDILDPRVYGSGLAAGTVAEALARRTDGDGEVTLSGLLLELDDPPARALATAFASEAERIAEHDPEKIGQRFVDCAHRHSKERLFVRGDNASGIDRILEVREAHRRLGGNPASVPKPVV